MIHPHAVEATCISLYDLPVRLQACLVKLSAYCCNFAYGDGAWAISGAVSQIAHNAHNAPASNPTPALRTWQHEDCVIEKPFKPVATPEAISKSALIVHFDGRYKQGVRAGGFLI